MSLLRTERKAKTRNSDDDMIPMINIVFLLLIFFMIAGQITPRSDDMSLPSSISEAELAESEIEITVAADGVLQLNGEAVQGELSESLNRLKTDEKTVVICRVHSSLPASTLDPVLRAVRALGVSRLQIATELAS